MTKIADTIARELGADRLVTDEAAVAAHRTDYWILAHLRRRQGRLAAPPCAVVQPRNPAEVAAVVKIARAQRAPIVPYGGGSGVVGGATPDAGALVIDLRRLDQLLEVNDTSLTARAQGGLLGGEFERLLNARGYVSGHYPQSLALASLGGLVATRSAGQFSTLYGNMEDLCLGLEVVLPNGEIARLTPTPRSATGPSLREIFLGSEGTLGIITEVTVRIFPTPERRAMSAWTFDGMRPALDAIRRIMRVGWRPAVVRLYDGFEASQWHFKQWVPENTCALLLVSEGPGTLVEAEEAACAAIATAAGGTAIGSAPVEHWLERRNTVPSWDQFLDQEMMVDTIEISAAWDRVGALYDGVIAALKSRPGMLVASAHSSHSYRQGTNLYVTFAVKPEKFVDAEAAYVGAWAAVMEATLAAGGSISHHHGIGRMRVPWIERELGTAYPILRALKHALDPDGLMNPGVLLPA
jgi:alkyldihydroxyacetonephosphate synthase